MYKLSRLIPVVVNYIFQIIPKDIIPVVVNYIFQIIPTDIRTQSTDQIGWYDHLLCMRV